MPLSVTETPAEPPLASALFQRWRLILFDFDGTLVDSQHGIRHCMTAAFEGHGLEAPDMARIRSVVGLALEVAITELLPEHARADTPAVAQRYREAALALRSSDAFHEPLFEGALETVRELDRPELCLGIATGKNLRGLEFSLAYHGLKDHFFTLHTPDTSPSKPHPDMVQRAMAICGCEPEETVVIGDTSFDMEMARAAGAAALGVSWGYHSLDRLQESGAQGIVHQFSGVVPELFRMEGVSR